MKKVYLVIAVAVLMLGAGAFFVFYRTESEIIQEPIPTAQIYDTPKPIPTTEFLGEPELISDVGSPVANEGVNLAVPFTAQAPHVNWEDPYGEFCEEASVLMAAAYVLGFDISDPDTADKKLHEIKDFELGKFGYHKDTTAEETALILREFYKIERVQVVYEPTFEIIKNALNEKRVVIIPAAGRQLGNPYFRQPGPLYHMLVIKGYTKEGNFITNDPGTRRGADFIYSPDILMNAIHDWNNGDVDNGKKVILVVG